MDQNDLNLNKQNENENTQYVKFENQTSSKEEFPSAKLLLSFLQKEYDNANDIKKQFDTRATALIAFSGVLLGFFINKLDIKKIINQPLFSVILLLLIICFLISVNELLKVVKAREYKRIEIEPNKEVARLEEDKVALKLADFYNNAITFNVNENKSKANHFEKGVNYLSISALILVLLYILSSLYY